MAWRNISVTVMTEARDVPFTMLMSELLSDGKAVRKAWGRMTWPMICR